MLLLFAANVRADDHRPTSIDYQLLKSDAVVFATVSDLRSEANNIASVTLEDLNVIGSRWSLNSSQPLQLKVRGQVTPDASLEAARHNARLEHGGRYLFLLRGGKYDDAPIIRGLQAIYEVKNGVLQCAGGQIFGIRARGFNCSVRDRQAAEPLTESAMSKLLVIALENARLRKPSLASTEDAAKRTLNDKPEEQK